MHTSWFLTYSVSEVMATTAASAVIAAGWEDNGGCDGAGQQPHSPRQQTHVREKTSVFQTGTSRRTSLLPSPVYPPSFHLWRSLTAIVAKTGIERLPAAERWKQPSGGHPGLLVFASARLSRLSLALAMRPDIKTTTAHLYKRCMNAKCVMTKNKIK